MKVNEMVQVHNGSCSMGGMFIYERFITGTVVKVNAKSIRVHMSNAKCTTSGKVTREYDVDETATFTFWKTIENKQFGKNAGKTVSIYKNNKYGVIEIVR